MRQAQKREARAEEIVATEMTLGCSEFEDTLDGERPTRQERSSGVRLRANRHQGRHAKPIIESAAHHGGKTDRLDWRCLAACKALSVMGVATRVWAEGLSTRIHKSRVWGKLSRLQAATG